MIVFTWIANAINGIIAVLSAPISYLGGLNLISIGVALTSVTIVKRFLLDPLFSRHKQDSATEKKGKDKNE